MSKTAKTRCCSRTPKRWSSLQIALVLLSQTALASEEPFKFGTFEHDGEVILGIVLRDQLVVDLARTNASLERRRPLWVELPMPSDMNELIGRYEFGMRERVHAIVDALVPEIDGARRPAYVHELSAVEPNDGTTATVLEAEYYVEAGMTPLEALRTATIAPATLLGLEDAIGSIEPGKFADIVALESGPSENISTLRRMLFVMKGGRIYHDERPNRLVK